ncbi:MAG: hypothetical protein AAF525_12005 [Pseudomonadota bacterium]
MRFPIAMVMVLMAAPTGAATCSCAGAPLLGVMDAGGVEQGQWYVGSTFVSHDISDLVSGTDEVPDQTGRDRSSISTVVEGSYGLTERWTVSGVLSRIRHERRIGNNTPTETKGFGDSLIMFKYAVVPTRVSDPYSVSAGLGFRIPSQDDDLIGNLVTAAEDLQPSTGASGTLIWTRANYTFDAFPATTWHASATLAFNGENDRDYRFGDEILINVGVQAPAPEHILGIKLPTFQYAYALKYRHGDRHQRRDVEIPNTGGQWLDLAQSIEFAITPRWGARLNVAMPIWRNLNDALQFTTSSEVALTLSYAP